MTAKNYNDIVGEMKELADKINKHYDTVTLETVEELDTPESENQRILNELLQCGVLTESDLEEVDWKNIPKWPTNKKGGIEYDEIGSQSDPTSEKFVHKQFMEISNRLDWIAERFSEDSMLARKTGEIGGDTGGFGKVSQAADMLLSAVEEVHRDAMGHIHQESTELDEAPKYELYHKDFSSAMQHAYKMAKKLHGITVDPKEIDDKVASGPRKPSEGKTNSYRLEGDKGAIQVQVYNKGGNKPYELNFYSEEG